MLLSLQVNNPRPGIFEKTFTGRSILRSVSKYWIEVSEHFNRSSGNAISETGWVISVVVDCLHWLSFMERRQPSMSIETPDAVTDAGTRSSVRNEGAPRAEPFDVPTHVRHLAKIAVIVTCCKSELIAGAHAVHFPRTHLLNPLIKYKNPCCTRHNHLKFPVATHLCN